MLKIGKAIIFTLNITLIINYFINFASEFITDVHKVGIVTLTD